jgi:hypothetical protein
MTMMIRNATPEFNEALVAFLNTTQARLDAEYARNYGGYPAAPQLTVDPGVKNVRVVASGPAQRSVFCFIRIADGAVLKADGWKKPAKHARGSIHVNAGQDVAALLR